MDIKTILSLKFFQNRSSLNSMVWLQKPQVSFTPETILLFLCYIMQSRGEKKYEFFILKNSWVIYL